MARLLDNYYILKTESEIKLTYVRSVPGEGDAYGERNPENGKSVCNLRRAKGAFLDLGQCNHWQYMGTFTAAADDPEKDIRRFTHWLNDWNHHHNAHIKFLCVFELGEKGRRLHVHVLLMDVPPDFAREYTTAEYAALPRDVKKLYSQYKTETGTRLACCPWWKFGWSTLVPCDDSPKVVSYMTKYMTKSSIEFTTKFGGHAYFSSLGLNRPEKRKIPTQNAATIWERIPANAWFRKFEYNGDTISTCYIMDKDKLTPELWNYYTNVYESAQVLAP